MAEQQNVLEFIARWEGREGGQERANYALFLTELCDVLGVPRPEPANASHDHNNYVFERLVTEQTVEGKVTGRIDLYRRGSFVLEAKQSRQKGGKKELSGQDSLSIDDAAQPKPQGKRTASRGWDVLMLNARRQAERYAKTLPPSHGWPPFILVCDVGHCIEVYADFSGQGKNYSQFPDRQSFRIYLEDLGKEETRELLRAIWLAPKSLDPSQRSAKVTREIALRLAHVSKALEKARYPAKDVSQFLMRCLFTMFAEDVGLLPERSFQELLERCTQRPESFVPMVEQLWQAMDEGGFAYALEIKVKRFNGEFFSDPTAYPLGREEIGELLAAARADWRQVEPAIFGTLVEQALDPAERDRLGAHYTPRAYVERLVIATVIEPLREDWLKVLSTVERQKSEKRSKDAIKTVSQFHEGLCSLRILDPACGTGNFLYVSLELLKRLEGEVLEALADLGGQEAFSALQGYSVDTHQFLGLEVNPRAAAIAELVLWIGYLQWHFRTKGSPPAEPILRAFHNIQGGLDAVLTSTDRPARPEWPEADFIVGNPPFIGGKDIRARLGGDYAEALWKAHPQMNDAADFVMYWWDHAASLLTRKGTALRRFGFVTTNSITQVFQRKVTERHLKAKKPVSLLYAIPDHPWTKATRDAAAVRIAMTVAAAGSAEGVIDEVTREEGLDTDYPTITFRRESGTINADLTIGLDLNQAELLLANRGLCSRGVVLHGAGFIVKASEAKKLGLATQLGIEKHLRRYSNGKDLTSKQRDIYVIDLHGLQIDEVRQRFPEIYQHLLLHLKPERDKNPRSYRRENWWLFGENIPKFREALSGLMRYIATVETAKHRVFQFLDIEILPDNKLISIASDDAFHLAVLSSQIHAKWALASGGWLGVGNDPVYVKSRCFDPFPFPDVTEAQKREIRRIAEELDAHRKRQLGARPKLTLTGLYNVLELVRSGASPGDLSPEHRIIFDDGLVMILHELHQRLDYAVAEAYGWPVDLPEQEMLARLVALNRERLKEEASGKVRWLRPSYQSPRFGKELAAGEQLSATLEDTPSAKQAKPSFPMDDMGQTAAIIQLLMRQTSPLSVVEIAASFRQGKRIKTKATAVLDALARMAFVHYDGENYLLAASSDKLAA